MCESQAAVRSGTQAEPNVTPFLDVLLVLLIIFMYLSLSQQKVITALLPHPTPAPGTYGRRSFSRCARVPCTRSTRV